VGKNALVAARSQGRSQAHASRVHIDPRRFAKRQAALLRSSHSLQLYGRQRFSVRGRDPPQEETHFAIAHRAGHEMPAVGYQKLAEQLEDITREAFAQHPLECVVVGIFVEDSLPAIGPVVYVVQLGTLIGTW
jgi:hypothetical protein